MYASQAKSRSLATGTLRNRERVKKDIQLLSEAPLTSIPSGLKRFEWCSDSDDVLEFDGTHVNDWSRVPQRDRNYLLEALGKPERMVVVIKNSIGDSFFAEGWRTEKEFLELVRDLNKKTKKENQKLYLEVGNKEGGEPQSLNLQESNAVKHVLEKEEWFLYARSNCQIFEAFQEAFRVKPLLPYSEMDLSRHVSVRPS